MPYKDKADINAASARWRRAHPENFRASLAHWRAAHPDEIRAYAENVDPEVRRAYRRKSEAKRRALKKGACVENVDPAVVLKRDGGICGICREPITGEWHLDHIVPLARGGEHSYLNTQASHPFCNMSKGAGRTERTNP